MILKAQSGTIRDMKGIEDMKDKLNGWQIVALVAIVLSAFIALVYLGQTLGAVVTAALAILGVLGYNTAQNKTNNDLANGRLTALQDQLAEKDRVHSEDMARMLTQAAQERATLQLQIREAHEKAAMYAALAPPESKVEV